MPKPPQRELDAVARAAMVRLFDRTGNVGYVAETFGCDPSQVFSAVLADTRRSVAPRDPSPAKRLFIVPKTEVA